MELLLDLTWLFNSPYLWWIIGVMFLVCLEIAYIFLVCRQKKRYDESWFGYALLNKFLAALISIAGVGVIGLIVYCLPLLLIVAGVVAAAFGFIYMNVLIAKRFAKEETQEEYKKRQKKPKSKTKSFAESFVEWVEE